MIEYEFYDTVLMPLLKEAHEYKKHPHEDNPDKCIRCYEYKFIRYALKLCDKCQDELRINFPEKYEESRLENMRLFDEQLKRE